MSDFNRLLLVVNEHSTSLRNGDPAITSQLNELKREFPGYEELHTTTDAAADIAVIQDLQREGDIVAPLGGDATVAIAVAAAANKRFQGLGIVVAALGGGNANDLRKSLTGNTSMVDQVRYGLSTPVHPLRIGIEHPDGSTDEHLTPHSFALGVSALLSAMASDATYRKNKAYRSSLRRMVNEGKFALKALQSAPLFQIQEQDANEPTHCYEQGFYNTSHAGRHGRPPVDPNDPRAYNLQVNSLAPLPLSRQALRMVTGTLPRQARRYITPDQPRYFTLLTDNVLGQCHGEVAINGKPLVFNTGTRFEIAIHDYSVHMLKTVPDKYPTLGQSTK